MNNDWLVFDQLSKRFYPFITGNSNELPLHLKLNTKEHEGLFLSINSKLPVSLYVNNKYTLQCSADIPKLIPFDSLSTLYGENVLLSFYGKYNQKLIDSSSIVTNQVNVIQNNLSLTINQPLLRISNFSRNYFAVILLFSIAFLATIRTIYTKIFDQYVSFSSIVQDFQPSTNSRVNFDSYNFVFIFLGLLFFGLACISFPVFDNVSDKQTFADFFGGMLYIMFASVVFYFVKFLTTLLVSWLFSINKFAVSHFLIFVRVSVLWSITLIILAMLKYSTLSWVQSILLPLFLFFSLFFLTLISIKVSFLINRVTKISTLYLISYLCVTEWLPYFVILKLYMVYFY